METLKDATAIITGASSGIGKAIAMALAAQGVKLGLVDIDSENLNLVKKDIDQLVDCECFAIDITNHNQLKAAFDQFILTFKKIDILVNAAGIWDARPILQMREEEMDRMLDVNFKGVYHFVKLVIPKMVERKKGKIISVSSIAGKMGSGVASHYAASKGAVIAFTKSLARELAPYGILINAITPGAIDTPMGQKTGKYGKIGVKSTPLKRFGKPEEVASLVVYLASAESNFVTGQAWNVCGGNLMD